MELRVLNNFLVVAREGNISTAAKRLHIGQPALSRQLKELERELGVKLFVRQPHGIRLTDEGQLLRQYAKEMSELVEKIDSDFSVMRTRPFGDVYIGGIDVSLSRGARLMKQVHENHPDIVFHYFSCSSSYALNMLDRGLLDFAVVSQYVRVTQYNTLPLKTPSQWIAFMRSDNPLARKASVSAADLMDEPLLMYDQALKAELEYNSLAHWFGEDFSRLTVVATSNLSSALNAYAREGLGTLLTLKGLEHDEARGMVSLPLDPPIETEDALVWRKDRPLSSTASYILELVEARVIQDNR